MRPDEPVNGIRHHIRPPRPTKRTDPPVPQSLQPGAGTLVATNSAYGTYALAPGAIAFIYGSNLAAAPQQAPSQPLPITLGGVTVTLKDANGIVFPAPLFYVSPNQVSCLIPSAAAIGAA